MGSQGCGKGTQAKKIAEKYDLFAISTGQLFRDEMAQNSEIGNKIKSLMDAGDLVPDNITYEVFLNRMKTIDKGVILDGFPRNLEQAKWLDEHMKIDKVLILNIDENTSVQRISGRRMCKKCKAIFHIDFIKPKQKGVCDYCGGELYQREDDKPEAVRKRLKIYNITTKDVLKHYKEKGILIDINGEQSPEDVWKDIQKVLE